MIIRVPYHYHTFSSLSFLGFRPKPLHKVLFHPHTRPLCTGLSAATETSSHHSHPWPEWVTFVDRLKSLGYFPPSSDKFSYQEINDLKDPCLSFARDRFDLFRSFSKDDIQSLVEGGCPIIQRKVVNSAKRLRVYVGLQEKTVCDICILQGSCDRAYLMLGESDGVARMVDLMRLLLSYALDPGLISGAVSASSIIQAESGSRRVLNLLTTLIEASTFQATREFPKKHDHKKEQSISSVNDSLFAEKKKGDWTCPKCSFMNFSRNFRCRKCNVENPTWGSADVEMKKGDWKCSKCRVVNFASRRVCFGCKNPRPPQALNPGEWECSKCYFLNFRRNTTCFKCGGSNRSKEAVARGQDTK